MKKLLLLIVALATYSYTDNLELRPDAHGPIGIMADHSHNKNEIMLSHRLMVMQMNRLFNGTTEISDSSVEADYTVTPKNMEMSMHMLGAMWGYSNNITLTAMLNYKSNEMSMYNKMTSTTSNMNSDGLGDLKIGAIFKVNDTDSEQLLVNSAISLPVGSIEEKNDAGNHLPYGMQLGSGTYDLILGSTYTCHKDNYSYGAQINGIFRLGENRNDYTLGNQYTLNGWAQKLWTDEISSSIRGTTQFVSDISGEDSTLSGMVTAMNPLYTTEQGSIRADIGFGINYFPKTNLLAGNRFAAELNIPVYHHTNAINTITDSIFTFGIQRAL